MNNDENKEVKIITENIKRDFGCLVRVLCLVGFSLFCDFYSQTHTNEISGVIAAVIGLICVLWALFVFVQYLKENKNRFVQFIQYLKERKRRKA